MEKHKKKILHITDSMGVGGAETVLVGIINGLPEFGNHLIILNDPETLLPKIQPDITFKNLHAKSLPSLLLSVGKIRRYIKKYRIDIVHSYSYLSNIISRLAAPGYVSVFNHLQNLTSLDAYKKNKLTLWLERLTYRESHHIIGVSNEVLKDFDKWVGIKGESSVLHNFIDDNFFGNPAKELDFRETLQLVAVGNLRYQKNYGYAIEAFKKIPAGISLDIFGEGELRAQLQSEIDEHNLPIRLLGSSNNLKEILPQYDAFLMTSLFEGLSVALLEAMASGLPALLSDIPVLKEIGGDEALYFNIENPDSLVQLLKEIFSGNHNLSYLSKKGLEKVEKIGKRDIYVKRISRIYNGINQKE